MGSSCCLLKWNEIAATQTPLIIDIANANTHHERVSEKAGFMEPCGVEATGSQYEHGYQGNGNRQATYGSCFEQRETSFAPGKLAEA